MAEKKSMGVSDMLLVLSKIMNHKLNGLNYLDWSKTVRLYLRSIDKDNHLTDVAPTDESKQTWLREDARLFLQIQNSIESEVIGLINHCEFVKELMDYLDFLYSGKENLSRMFDVCKAFYRAEKQDQSLTSYFMEFKKTYGELNMLLPFSPDVKVQQKQREQMAVMSFLAGLPSSFEIAKSQILSSSDISSLQEVFGRILRTEGPPPAPMAPISGALLTRHAYDSGRPTTQHNFKVGGSQVFDVHPKESGSLVCNYCHKPGFDTMDEDDEDEDNDEGGGLSKSGKELKKLLGRTGGLDDSDAEDDDDSDENDEDVNLSPVLPAKQRDAPNEEASDISSSKPITSGSTKGTPPTTKAAKGKRKLNGGDDVKVSNATPKKLESKSSVVKDEDSVNPKIGVPSKGSPAVLKAGPVPTGPVTEEEIQAVLLQKTPVTTQDLVAKFKARLRSPEDKNAFAAILRRISRIQKTNGPSYVVLRER